MTESDENGILLHADGNAFHDGKFDLRSLELIVYNYRLIIDNSLPIVIGQKTLTDRIKNEIKYEVEVRDGSLEVLLNFVLENPEILSVLATDGGYTFSQAISKLINGAINLRRALTKVLEVGLSPNIKIDQSTKTDNSVNLNIKTGDIKITNPQFIFAADNTKAAVDRLINGIDGIDISKVDMKHSDISTNLTTSDHDITGTSKEELTTNIEVLGRLDTVAFTSHRGHIITGNKRYPVTWDESIRSKIRKFVDVEGIIYRVRPIIDHRKFKDEPIGFHVTDCWQPQASFNI